MSTLHVLRVFVDSAGRHGNPLGVFLDGPSVARDLRQQVAAQLGFSETVFVDDVESGRVAIFTPGSELRFAGHPLVGSSWLLALERGAGAVLRPPAGDVPTWPEGDLRFIAGRAEWAPPMELRQLASAAEVEQLSPAREGFIVAWAWEDEERGYVRSRVFVPEHGIVEDEATGAAAVVMGAHLGRPLEIRQGRGSRLTVRPGQDRRVEVGGRVVLDEIRDHDV